MFLAVSRFLGDFEFKTTNSLLQTLCVALDRWLNLHSFLLALFRLLSYLYMSHALKGGLYCVNTAWLRAFCQRGSEGPCSRDKPLFLCVITDWYGLWEALSVFLLPCFQSTSFHLPFSLHTHRLYLVLSPNQIEVCWLRRLLHPWNLAELDPTSYHSAILKEQAKLRKKDKEKEIGDKRQYLFAPNIS